MKKNALLISFFSTSAALLLLAGCTPPFILGGAAATANYVLNKDVENLKARNYAAADYMIKQADNFIKRSDLIKAVPLHDALEPRLSSAVGEIVPYQVGTRLAQLGYRLDLSNVARQGENSYMAPAVKTGEHARYILSGTYARVKNNSFSIRNELAVDLRITDTKTGRILSAFDYVMVMNGDIDEYSQAKPVIIRTTAQ